MSDDDKDIVRILAHQRYVLDQNLASAQTTGVMADEAIGDAERLLESLGEIPTRAVSPAMPLDRKLQLRDWDEIAAEAKAQYSDSLVLEDILDKEEINVAAGRLSRWKKEFAELNQLTRYDYAVAGAAGVFGGLADILLVQIPRHPKFLGGHGSEGGWLSNIIKDKFNDLLPAGTIRDLEKNFGVPYDPSTSRGLNIRVDGLGPRSHRMASLGHDPLLGWFFGVRDILAGGFTAIGSDGRLVIQSVPGWEPAEFGVGLFVKILEAFQSVAGHLLSDVATKAGLPPPLFGLLQFLQCGGIGDRSISDVARLMYRQGYDFRHFLAGGVTVAIIEVFVRTAWVVRELSEGKAPDNVASVPSRRLKNSLLLAHSVATAINAGKVAVIQNPLAVNWAQWLTFFGYLLPQIHWVASGRDYLQTAFVKDKLDASWLEIEAEFARTSNVKMRIGG